MKSAWARFLTNAWCALICACASGTSGTGNAKLAERQVAEGEELEKVTELGPVMATLQVKPAEPTVGDLMALTLTVEAEGDVSIDMPASSEVLGTFAIHNRWEEDEATAEGHRYAQHYRLQARSSGRMRIPPLRVVFRDQREGESAEERELLTEEAPLKVLPILPDDEAAAAELRPLRGELEEELGGGFFARYGIFMAVGAAALVAAAGLFFWWRRRKPAEETVSPFERATQALERLEARGTPEGDAIDDYYVELSGIVRHYLEGRFSLRAPELTTEEFLREAQKSVQLTSEQKRGLGAFLEDCDRVKFAAYVPEESEIRAALETARRFVRETHPEQDDGEDAQEAA